MSRSISTGFGVTSGNADLKLRRETYSWRFQFRAWRKKSAIAKNRVKKHLKHKPPNLQAEAVLSVIREWKEAESSTTNEVASSSNTHQAAVSNITAQVLVSILSQYNTRCCPNCSIDVQLPHMLEIFTTYIIRNVRCATTSHAKNIHYLDLLELRHYSYSHCYFVIFVG